MRVKTIVISGSHHAEIGNLDPIFFIKQNIIMVKIEVNAILAFKFF